MGESEDGIVVIGGGAAGFFGAIRLAELAPAAAPILLEASRKVLTKVHLSGGGRCNVTHACFDPAALATNYPRGHRELRAAFTRFQPRDTVAWFESRGVPLKTEADGRMFPMSDDAADVAACLEGEAAKRGVRLRLGAGVATVRRVESGFELKLKDESRLRAKALLLATGSSPAGLALAASLGHTLEPHVPSLFTFNIQDPRLAGLSGLSVVNAALSLHCEGQTKDEAKALHRSGPLLITHWGLSGPAVLKLSAFGALALHRCGYQAELRINFLPELGDQDILARLRAYRQEHGRQLVRTHGPFPAVPRRLWESLVAHAEIAPDLAYGELGREAMAALVAELRDGRYRVMGKGVFKDEFVSAGGVRLKEVDFRTMESRVCPGLHFAGEVLAVDGITGGFNFQAAWTSAWIAAEALAKHPG